MFKRFGKRGWLLIPASMICSWLMLGCVLPAANDAMWRHKADVVAQYIADCPGEAREIAMSRSREQPVTFAVNENRYEMPIWSDDDVKRKQVNLERWPFWTSLVEADFEGSSNVTFNMWGHSDKSGQVVIDAGGHRRRIVLDSVVGWATVEKLEGEE